MRRLNVRLRAIIFNRDRIRTVAMTLVQFRCRISHLQRSLMLACASRMWSDSVTVCHQANLPSPLSNVSVPEPSQCRMQRLSTPNSAVAISPSPQGCGRHDPVRCRVLVSVSFVVLMKSNRSFLQWTRQHPPCRIFVFESRDAQCEYQQHQHHLYSFPPAVAFYPAITNVASLLPPLRAARINLA